MYKKSRRESRWRRLLVAYWVCKFREKTSFTCIVAVGIGDLVLVIYSNLRMSRLIITGGSGQERQFGNEYFIDRRPVVPVLPVAPAPQVGQGLPVAPALPVASALQVGQELPVVPALPVASAPQVAQGSLAVPARNVFRGQSASSNTSDKHVYILRATAAAAAAAVAAVIVATPFGLQNGKIVLFLGPSISLYRC